MDYHTQKEKITFQIVPHTSSEIFSVRISRRVIKVIAIFLLISLLTLLGGLYYYYNQYQTAAPYQNKTKKLKEKNKHLKNKLAELSAKTKRIKQEFEQIQRQNKKIKQMVDFEAKIEQKVSSRPEEPKKEFRQVSQLITRARGGAADSKQLIRRTEANLNLLKKKLPQRKKNLSQLKQNVKQYKDYLVSRPKGWPIKGEEGRITSTFGYRIHPVLNKRLFHEGVDIGVWYHHKIVATGAGKVVFAGRQSGYGKVVIINHGFHYRTLYGHNSRILVEEGEYVTRGEPISLSGATGMATGPHVHYEIQYKREPINPMKYIK